MFFVVATKLTGRVEIRLNEMGQADFPHKNVAEMVQMRLAARIGPKVKLTPSNRARRLLKVEVMEFADRAACTAWIDEQNRNLKGET